MLAYTECMRDHGVDMPDPQTDGEGRTMIALDADPESGEFQEAQTACEPLMENAVEPDRDRSRAGGRDAGAAARVRRLHARPRHRHARPDVRRERPGRDPGRRRRDGPADPATTTTSRPPTRSAPTTAWSWPRPARPASDATATRRWCRPRDAHRGELIVRRWPIVGGAIVLAGAAGITGVVVSGRVGRRRRRRRPTDRRAVAGRGHHARPRAQRGVRRHGRTRHAAAARARRVRHADVPARGRRHRSTPVTPSSRSTARR